MQDMDPRWVDLCRKKQQKCLKEFGEALAKMSIIELLHNFPNMVVPSDQKHLLKQAMKQGF
jgi:hypothetical protein